MLSWDKNFFLSLSLSHTHTQACVHTHCSVYLCVSASIVLYMNGCFVVVLFFVIKQEALFLNINLLF